MNETRHDDIIIIGNDIGYGYDKLLARIVGQDAVRKTTLPSLIGPAIDIRYHSDLIGHGLPTAIRTNGKAWYYGDDARMQSPFTLSPRARSRDPETMRILMLAAMTRAGVTDGTVRMVTGLPVEWYSDRHDLTQALRGIHNYHIDDTPHRIEVANLLVVPQPFGSFVTVITDPDGVLVDQNNLAREKVGVIDVGMHTTDLALFDEMRYREPLSGSLSIAMARTYELIQRYVEQNTGYQITLQEAEEAAQTGKIQDRGEKRGVIDLVMQAKDQVAKKIVGYAATLWDSEERTIAAVLVTGGGAETVFPAIEQAFPQAILLPDAQMANADGFYRYALRKFK
jgi:plasmid segregation protein ParM